jgi:Uma2 family endonuclease
VSAVLTQAGQADVDEWDVPDGFELVDGRLVELPIGAESGLVAGELYRRLANYLDTNPIGKAIPGDIGFRCFPHRPRLLRKPDAAYIAAGRLPGDLVPKGDIRIAPDLVVEVVSPNDLAEAVQEKIDDYLAAGVRLIWVIYPTQRTATVYSSTACVYVRKGGELSGEEVIPGFTRRLEDILQPPNPSGPDDARSDAPA